MKKIIVTLYMVLLCGFGGLAKASPCLVQSEKDTVSSSKFGLSTKSTLRYKVQEIVNKGGTSCQLESYDIDAIHFNQEIRFDTEEYKETGWNAKIKTITIDSTSKPILLNAPDYLVIGNYSQEMIDDSGLELIDLLGGTSDTTYGSTYEGVFSATRTCGDKNSDGTFSSYDCGFVVIDGSALDSGVSPLQCQVDNAATEDLSDDATSSKSVYLRNLVIVTNGVSKSDLLGGLSNGDLLDSEGSELPDGYGDGAGNTTCLKNAGDVHVCNGKLAADADSIDPNTMSDSEWCDGVVDDGNGGGDTGGDTGGGHLPDIHITPGGWNFHAYYADDDGDGFGDANDRIVTMWSWRNSTYTDADGDGIPDGYVDNSDDCDDTNAAINPDASEICDGADNDCDGYTDSDDDGVTGESAWYYDGDSDNYGTAATSQYACSQPTGYVSDNTDCDDTDATLTTTCDVTNPECSTDANGNPDCSDTDCAAESYCQDADDDNYTVGAGDCNDNDATVNPGAAEICDDGIDNDCSGAIDDASSCGVVNPDCSVDAAGNPNCDSDTDCAAETYCIDADVDGFAPFDGDCDDTEPLAFPGGSEANNCGDLIDNDCNGTADDENVCASVSPIGGALEMNGGCGCQFDAAIAPSGANAILAAMTSIPAIGFGALRRRAKRRDQ